VVKRLVLIGVALLSLSSSSAAGAERAATLTGTAEWSDSSTHVHGTFDGSLGKGTYDGTLAGGTPFTSGECGPVCQPVTGSIDFSANRGSFTAVAQPGSVVALEDIASHSWRNFTLTLEVVDATRGYAHLNGSVLTLSYTSQWAHYFDSETFQFINTITDTGTLTAATGGASFAYASARAVSSRAPSIPWLETDIALHARR
jgi:hypothetical protein